MTSEERIEKVSQLLMEGMTDGKKSKENYLKIAQLEVDNIVSAITPISAVETSFILFALEQVTEMIKGTMKRYPKQEINYYVLKGLIGAKGICVEEPKRSKYDK